MLKHRLMSGFLIGTTLFLAGCYLPMTGILILLIFLSSVTQLEFYSMLNKGGISVFRYIGLLCGAVLIFTTFYTIGPEAEKMAKAHYWEHFILFASLIVIFVRQFPQKHNNKPLTTIACTLLGIWYIPYLFNFFTRLALTWDRVETDIRISETGRLLVLYLVVVVKSTDVGAFFVGKKIGKHKVFPRISPGKTWEGCLGGICVAVLFSLGFCWVANYKFGKIVLHMHDAVILGILLAIVGIAGDMFESLIKRATGIKDSSSIIPGMGGILDVFDSLLFGVPVLYFYVELFLI